MSCFALVCDINGVNCNGIHFDEIGISWVDHHGSKTSCKGAVSGHRNLASPTLFSRSTEDAYSSPKVACQRCRHKTRAKTSRGNDIVSTPMSDAGQRVVFK